MKKGHRTRTAEQDLTQPADNQLPRHPGRRWTRLVFLLCGILGAWAVTAIVASFRGPPAGPPSGALKAIFSVVLISFGVLCAALYWREPPRISSNPQFSSFYHRPWRRIGAAICLLVSVMFVLGVYIVDIPDNPKVYAAFWMVILALVFWACGLAIKDIGYTRKLLVRLRTEHLARSIMSDRTDESTRDPDS